MPRKIYLLLFMTLALCSCEKEINIDYRSIDPLYVVEGRVNNEAIEVLITRTRDMEEGAAGPAVHDATVVLTATDGTTRELQYGEDGYYRPADLLTGEPGETYSLSVAVGGNEFTSHSTMHGSVPIIEVYFHWMKVMSEKLLFCRFTIEDIAGQENYYHCRMYRNGEVYRWGIYYDRGLDGQLLPEDFICMSESMAEKNKPEDREGHPIRGRHDRDRGAVNRPPHLRLPLLGEPRREQLVEPVAQLHGRLPRLLLGLLRHPARGRFQLWGYSGGLESRLFKKAGQRDFQAVGDINKCREPDV